MFKLPEEIIQFFRNQSYVIVSTLGKNTGLHSSCKGIVQIDPEGRIYLVDLYRGRTYENLKNHHSISITAVDEHKFIGYCLKGRAEILPKERIEARIIKSWEEKIISRLTKRILKNIHEEKGHPGHPEALFPKPEYLIVAEVDEVVDLTPRHLKEE